MDTDFAFFVVNFHMSREDFESLTQREKAFITKAYENKIVMETQLINNAVANAIANVNRKKGKKWEPLWKRKPKRAETETMKNVVASIKKNDTDKSWVKRIYDANGKLALLEKRKESRNG